ncbi:Uncharacterized protein Rs2_44146 [Raphanus sativus]|nr:Uncharacterized protein Rs2_44146 [Raphanus sativus]
MRFLNVHPGKSSCSLILKCSHATTQFSKLCITGSYKEQIDWQIIVCQGVCADGSQFCLDHTPRLLWQRIELVLKRFGAHHTDLIAATQDDSEWLKQQRRQEIAIIEK